MLGHKYLSGLPEALVELYAQVEADILADMARRISTYDYYIPSAEHQRRALREMGALEEDILRQLSRRSGRTEQELQRLMQEAAETSLAYDEDIYRAHGLDPPPLGASPELQKVLAAGLKQTQGLFRNLTRTTAHTASGQFEAALDRAWLQVSSGAFDYNTAIRTAVKDLSRQGVGAIRYPSGHVDTLETATRRAVVTGVNQTCGKLQLEQAREMGCDLMELTAHPGARPDHAIWQGQIVSLSGAPEYLSLSDIGYGKSAGFKGWNCRHDWNPYFEGSPRSYTPEQLEAYEARDISYNGQKLTEYEAGQRQREIERNIRRWKRENRAMEAAGLDASESAAKIRQWQETQRDFLRQTGLKRQAEREQIAGWSRSDAARVSTQARRATLTNAVGQRIIKTKKTSSHGTPGSITQVVSSRGGISRNYYDAAGRWARQITNNDHGNPKMHPYGGHGEHAHDIVWKDGKIVDRPIRDLTELEREENADIL